MVCEVGLDLQGGQCVRMRVPKQGKAGRRMDWDEGSEGYDDGGRQRWLNEK